MESSIDDRIVKIRRFNRFYTRQIGVIDGRYLATQFSLTEARVIYEIANTTDPSATMIKEITGLDAGYLSRIIQRLHRDGLVDKQITPHDGRQSILQLTDKGKTAFNNLNSRSQDGIREFLKPVSEADQIRMVKAMETIETILDPASVQSNRSPFIIRQPVCGDMGWVIQRHGEIYFEEYNWNEEFEALVAEIVAKFMHDFDAARERCWIAEKDGENIGCIFLVKKDEETAKLRLLLVDPKVRGMGLGAKLIEECIRFARRCGYKKMVLWTNSVLLEARHLYQKFGFTLVEQEEHHSFGQDLVGENWELIL
jgi:DNA-binding MarR family transcriptional regulator/N-acetylglutamate synthase-like GNAT family acetyltransferase